MHILVTGGTGLIGTHLVPSLLASGHRVTVLTRSAKPTQIAGLVFAEWDGSAIPTQVHATEPVDAIVNLAGAGIADERWTPEYKKKILESRIQATTACVRYIRAMGSVQVFVSSSAIGYYGTTSTALLDEAAPAGHDFLALTARKWETAAADAGVRTVILRTGVVLANEGGAYPKLLTPFKFYAGGYLGDGKQPFPWVHVADVVGLIEFALNNSAASGPINAVAPELLNHGDFARLIGHLLNRPAGLPVPAFVAKAMLGESAMLVLDGQRVKPAAALRLGYTFRFTTAEAALRQLMAEKQA